MEIGWRIAWVAAAIVVLASAIAFGYFTLFLLPIGVAGYVMFRVISGFAVRNPAYSPRAGVADHFADGQPTGRALWHEAQINRDQDDARRERAQLEAERARYSPPGEEGPPPNVPFP